MTAIATASQLEDAVGSRPAAAHLKSISSLDPHCVDFLAHATYAVVGIQRGDGTQATTTVGGPPGILTRRGSGAVGLPLGAGAADATHGAPAGLVALVPGYRETLRINGRLHVTTSTDGSTDVELRVEEAFLHCAKCMIRSHLWEEVGPSPAADEAHGDLHTPAIADFLGRAPFVTLATTDGAGCADVSPKGDPPGFLTALGPLTLALPDRPGNRRTDSLHNLVEHAQIALSALVPGDRRVLHVEGTAAIRTDEDLRAGFEVRGNRPSVVVVVEVATAALRVDQAITSARLWDADRHVARGALPRASRIWTDHVKLNDDPGRAAQLARAAVSEPLMRAGIAADYRANLY